MNHDYSDEVIDFDINFNSIFCVLPSSSTNLNNNAVISEKKEAATAYDDIGILVDIKKSKAKKHAI